MKPEVQTTRKGKAPDWIIYDLNCSNMHAVIWIQYDKRSFSCADGNSLESVVYSQWCTRRLEYIIVFFITSKNRPRSKDNPLCHLNMSKQIGKKIHTKKAHNGTESDIRTRMLNLHVNSAVKLMENQNIECKTLHYSCWSFFKS